MTGLNQRITTYIGDTLNLDNDKREVIAYSLELIFHTLATILLVMLTAWLTGLVKETAILLVVMFLFKSLAGGAHCSSAVRCTILSILLVPSLGYLGYIAGQHFSNNSIIMLTFISITFSCFMIYRVAPLYLPIVSARHKQNRRYISLLLLVLITILQIILIFLMPEKTSSYVTVIDLGIFWQALMLTKPGHALIRFYDGLLFCLMNLIKKTCYEKSID